MEKSTQNLLRVEAIFHEAIAVPPDAREELVAELSNGDSELAAEVHSLLKASAAEETESASRSNLAASAHTRSTVYWAAAAWAPFTWRIVPMAISSKRSPSS
jgi:hypothetical protein